jgi:hypothetical protein
MKIFPAKLRYNQRFAIAGYVTNREYCIRALAAGADQDVSVEFKYEELH